MPLFKQILLTQGNIIYFMKCASIQGQDTGNLNLACRK
jgi:hypothetical protein